MAKKTDEVKQLEKIIKTLDTLFDKGQDCIHPFTGEMVLDNEYDAIKQKLFELYPKSKIFQTPTASTKKIKNLTRCSKQTFNKINCRSKNRP